MKTLALFFVIFAVAICSSSLRKYSNQNHDVTLADGLSIMNGDFTSLLPQSIRPMAKAFTGKNQQPQSQSNGLLGGLFGNQQTQSQPSSGGFMSSLFGSGSSQPQYPQQNTQQQPSSGGGLLSGLTGLFGSSSSKTPNSQYQNSYPQQQQPSSGGGLLSGLTGLFGSSSSSTTPNSQYPNQQYPQNGQTSKGSGILSGLSKLIGI